MTFALGFNEFVDLTKDEFAAASAWSSLPRLGMHEYDAAPLASSVDLGVVSPMKYQGQCGSCLTFSTTGCLVSLSEQQFDDCDYTCSGCNGGLMDYAFAFANKNAICAESSYIYTGTKGTYSSSSCTVGLALGSVTSFKDMTVNIVEAHMDALVQEPVSVAIEADSVSFQLYSGGVMTFWCGTNLDRGVPAVGYDTDGSSDYWKIKNSWGSSWDESGFLRPIGERGQVEVCT